MSSTAEAPEIREVSLRIHCPKYLADALRAEAERQGMSVGELARMWFHERLGM